MPTQQTNDCEEAPSSQGIGKADRDKSLRRRFKAFWLWFALARRARDTCLSILEKVSLNDKQSYEQSETEQVIRSLFSSSRDVFNRSVYTVSNFALKLLHEVSEIYFASFIGKTASSNINYRIKRNQAKKLLQWIWSIMFKRQTGTHICNMISASYESNNIYFFQKCIRQVQNLPYVSSHSPY